MKIKSIIFFVLIFLSVNCIGQALKSKYKPTSLKAQSDSIYFNKNLTVFYVDSCLYDLLNEVVNADSSNITYPPVTYFYSLSFSEKAKTKGFQYLSVWPQLWNNSEYLDYTGVVKIGKIRFLCRGDFATDSKFHKAKNKKVVVKLRKNKNDSFENVFNREPSLQGEYHDCEGKPIYIEIYVKGKIADFEMDIPKKK